jgi:hypothetical protein
MKLQGREVERYWLEPPPESSPRLSHWLAKVAAGWQPNRRISGMGYYEAAEWYGVYIWEWLNVLRPAIDGAARGNREGEAMTWRA